MVGEGTVPNAEGSDIIGSTIRGLTREAFVIALAFKYSAIAKNDTGTDDTRVSVEMVESAIRP